MTKIRIRSATTADSERLGHIGVATFVDSYTHDIDGDAMVAHCTTQHAPSVYARYLQDAATAAWIAECEATGAPVGYALNCRPDLPVPLEPGDVELKRIYVLSKFHGTGTGLALLEAAIAHAKLLNAPRLLLGTYEENELALKFYRRAGFQRVGTRQFQVGTRLYDDIVLAKSLHVG